MRLGFANAFASGDKLIRKSRRLRQTKTGATLQHEPFRIFKHYTMTDADEQRANTIPRADDAGNGLAAMREPSRTAASLSGFNVIPAQTTLGTAQRRPIQQDAHVTGQSESTRMRQSVAIGHEHIRPGFELRNGVENGRRFAETQQAGNIGEFASANGRRRFDDFFSPPIPDDTAGNNGFAVVCERSVRPRDESDSFADWFESNLIRKRSLQFDRFFRRKVPTMLDVLGHDDNITEAMPRCLMDSAARTRRR